VDFRFADDLLDLEPRKDYLHRGIGLFSTRDTPYDFVLPRDVQVKVQRADDQYSRRQHCRGAFQTQSLRRNEFASGTRVSSQVIDVALLSGYSIQNSVYGIRKTECNRRLTMKNNIRVLLAKVGLDGHDRGVKIVARCLRDAGMDVVYTGLHRSPEEVVSAAVQEDVDVLAVSLLSGAHMTIFPKIIAGLKARGVDDMILVGGGVMPDEDVVALKKMGVHEVLLQDTPPNKIIETIERLVAGRGER